MAVSTPFAADASPRARFDDVARGAGYEFDGHVRTWVAGTIDDVVPALAAAEAEAVAGNWVVGFVAYEAAPAFDRAFPIPAAGDALPLAWFSAYSQRREVPLVMAPDEAPVVVDTQRVHGSEWYRCGVQTVRRRIEAGDVYQVNLTDRITCTLHGDPYQLYGSMVSTQGGSFNAYLDLGEHVVVSASPELFLQIDGDTITTRPMKGTRRRHGRPDADAQLAHELRHSAKDLAENVMIVDLLRNDLTRVSSPGGVSVPELFRVERYETVWQLTSTVVARLRPEVGLVDVFAATFPCGSITGAPKVSAMHVIGQLEPTPRGVYCGTIGMISPAVGGARPASVWSVAIRTAVVERSTGRVQFGAGGGITYDSVPVDEDDEMESKTTVLRRARAGFQLFETLRLDEKGVHHLALHLQRLAASAEYFGFPCDTATIARGVMAIAPATHPRRLRLLLDRSGRSLLETSWLDPPSATVRLAVSSARVRSDDPFLCHKTTRRDTYEDARAEFSEDAADDVLLVNERDEVVESTVANLLYQLDGHWYTPPLTSGGLPGVGRQALLAYGAVNERVLPLAELDECDALDVVSSLRGRRRAARVHP